MLAGGRKLGDMPIAVRVVIIWVMPDSDQRGGGMEQRPVLFHQRAETGEDAALAARTGRCDKGAECLFVAGGHRTRNWPAETTGTRRRSP